MRGMPSRRVRKILRWIGKGGRCVLSGIRRQLLWGILVSASSTGWMTFSAIFDSLRKGLDQIANQGDEHGALPGESLPLSG